MSDKKPNILFLMSDEHRPDFVGYAGDKIVRTPNLDWLAETGVVFNNCYTPSPICVPGRQAIMSGQLPMTCGCLNYGDDLPANYMTFAKRFSQYAYNTCVCGKLHHYGTDQMQGWGMRVGYDNEVNHKRFLDGFKEEEAKKYEIESQWWPWDKEVRKSGIGISPHLKRDEFAVMGACQYIDDYFVSEFYEKKSDHKPLLLKVSLTMPHYPFFTDKERFDYYYDKVQPFLNEETFDHPGITRDWDCVKIGEQVSENDVRRATAAYYGMIDKLDEMYGQVLDALRDAGQNLDDWIIIYTTDHGEMLGQHGIWMKYKFFEASARVPFIIRWPKKYQPGTIDENVNLCDLFATLCDFADIEIPEGLDSRSLVSLLEGKKENWDNETISQIGGNLMIKRDHLKYQFYDEGPDVLFDMIKNPEETKDYINDPDYADAVCEFRQRAAELGYGPNANPAYVNAGY